MRPIPVITENVFAFKDLVKPHLEPNLSGHKEPRAFFFSKDTGFMTKPYAYASDHFSHAAGGGNLRVLKTIPPMKDLRFLPTVAEEVRLIPQVAATLRMVCI